MFPSASTSDLDRGLSGFGAFLYGNSFWLVVVSVAWAVSSAFVVTVGPATLGAYVAILGLLSDRNRVEFDRVRSVCRRQFLPATAFGLLPPLFFGLSGAYAYSLTDGVTPLRVGGTLATFYVGLYLALVMVPTFVALARGRSGADALRAGVSWVAAKPTLAMLTGMVTLAVFVVTALLTVGFLLMFAGVAFSFQVRVVGEDV